MQGKVVQINVSLGGLPKLPVPEGRLTRLGIEGDQCAHPGIHGGVEKAILLLCAETIDELIAQGYPLSYGAMGENLTVSGLNPRELRPGQRYRAGTALIELAAVRSPCSSLDVYGPGLRHEIYDKAVRAGDPSSPRWGRSGFYAAVVEPGIVRVHDIISLAGALV